jgi:hypothetical protein
MTFAVSLAFTLGCTQKAEMPVKPGPIDRSLTLSEASLWHIDLKVSPDHPSMAKPITFKLHITDEHGQPVNAAEVNGAITMKLMDMGTTQIKFAPKGNGDYQASVKDMDMSGAWNLAVDATQGAVRAKKSFEFTVYD